MMLSRTSRDRNPPLGHSTPVRAGEHYGGGPASTMGMCRGCALPGTASPPLSSLDGCRNSKDSWHGLYTNLQRMRSTLEGVDRPRIHRTGST